MAKVKAAPRRSIGELIDLGRELEQKRIEYQREVDSKLAEMKAREEEIEKAIIDYCESNKVEKISGTEATATFHKNPTPTVDPEAGGWTAIYAHIKKTGEFDLLEKRLGKLAYRERLDRGVRVPGITTFWKKSISFSKFGSK